VIREEVGLYGRSLEIKGSNYPKREVMPTFKRTKLFTIARLPVVEPAEGAK
jgi:hypothetical protein